MSQALTGDKTSHSSAEHWDAFWRARDKAVPQPDAGARDPAPAEFWHEFLKQEFALYEHPRLIDIACGNGAVTAIAMEAAHRTGASLTAHCVDYSMSAVEELRKRFPQVEGVACDAREMPYDDRSFDLVVSQFGIEYAGVEAFEEAARLVDTNGVLAAIVHMADGAIEKECAANLAVVEALNEAQLMPLARAAFGAGFDLIAGKITDPDFQQFDKQLAPAIEVAKKILQDEGPLAAGGLLANLYRDIAYMYTRMQNYVPEEVFAWIDQMSDELVSYEGRMASMTHCAVDEATITEIAERVAPLGFTVQPRDVLSLRKTGKAAAWILIARRVA